MVKDWISDHFAVPRPALCIPALAALAALAAAPAHAGAAVRATIVPWGAAATLHLKATPIRAPLATPEGPGTIKLFRATGAAAAAKSGEGVIALTMTSPGTSWASEADTDTVAEVSVDGAAPQTIELFAGPSRFTYEGFLGPLAAGRHTVTVLNSTSLAHAADTPAIHVDRAQLGIVPRSDSEYWAEAYAPFIYGRSTSATGYIPLLTYVNVSTGPDGSHELSYTYVISAHDQGDSLVPAYQWGTWGRMTDIVSVIDETVAPNGTVTSAAYSSCACEGTPYPDTLQSPSDSTTKAFTGSWLGHHPMLRDATATNYLSQTGTTSYRFQQAPDAGPQPGAVRESVMDAHPWTYEISNQELPREHLISTSPDDLLVGDYRQYAIVDADLDTSGSDGVEFDVQIAGSSTWYTTDYAQMTGGVPSTFVFHDGGHNRWVIKLPMNWQQRRITALRIRLTVAPGGPAPTLTVLSLKLLEITQNWQVRRRDIPSPTVAQATALDPEALPL
jgi:hypothetical protein